MTGYTPRVLAYRFAFMALLGAVVLLSGGERSMAAGIQQAWPFSQSISR